MNNFNILLNNFASIVNQVATTIWDLHFIIFIIASGLFLTIYLFFPQLRFFWHAGRVIWGKYVKLKGLDEFSSFKHFCIAISTPIGLGSVAGVAVAITTGGPGSIFWMWVFGLFGMAHKLTCISSALIFREQCEEHKNLRAGPMFTMKNGLGKFFRPLNLIYCISLIMVAFCAGGMFQANQMATMIHLSFGVNHFIAAIILVILTSMSLIFGKKNIADLVAQFAPTMILIYFLGATGLIVENYAQIPNILSMIFEQAFSGNAALGGIFGVACKEAIVHGVRRAIFSNEAGIGTSAMAPRPAKINPIQEGIVGMVGPVIDTMIVSTMTALVIFMTNTWTSGMTTQGVELTAMAFSSFYGKGGKHLITLFVILFAFSTILSWSYYGEVASEFLFKKKIIIHFRYIFVLFIFLGALSPLQLIIDLSDIFIALMAVPNIITNLFMSHKIRKELKKFKNDLRAERI